MRGAAGQRRIPVGENEIAERRDGNEGLHFLHGEVCKTGREAQGGAEQAEVQQELANRRRTRKRPTASEAAEGQNGPISRVFCVTFTRNCTKLICLLYNVTEFYFIN